MKLPICRTRQDQLECKAADDRLRVVLIAPYSVDYAYAFATAVASGADLLALMPRAFVASRSPPSSPNLTICPVDWPPRHRNPRNPAFVLTLLRIIRRYKPDIIHVLQEKNVWLNLLMPFLGNVPVVTTVHDVEYHPGDTTSQNVPCWCPRLFIRQSDAIIVHGAGLARQAKTAFRKAAADVHVMRHLALPFYAGLASRIDLHREEDREITVLFYGRIQMYKGIHVLIDAAPHVASAVRNVKFVIAGRSDHLTRPILMKATAPYYDLRDRFVPDAETAALFAAADIVALPYIEASQSGVLAIAYTFGLPVVASDVGELGAAVERDETGLVIPPADPDVLAAALIRLAQDAGLRAAFGRRAREVAETTLGPSEIGQKALAIYRQVIARRRNQSTRDVAMDEVR
jgi:glycosyltransferase involved in cell wall biosynthesis